MQTVFSLRATNWQPQHFSYVVVGGASLLGLAAPGAAPMVLAPVLLVGLIGLGLAHGACDQLVLPAVRPVRGGQWRYLLRFVLGYLGVAATAGLGWWQWPGAAVSTFLLLTVWHWGSADAPAQPGRSTLWLAHSVLRGALLFAVPARWWPAYTQHSVEGLLAFAGAAALAPHWFEAWSAELWPLVGVGHLVLWSCYARLHEPRRWRTDALEALLLTGLFVALPPLLALGVYFVFWHSLQHALRLTRLFGYAGPASPRPAWLALGSELLFFLRRALPLLLVSLAALAGCYALLRTHLTSPDAWLSIALVAAAVLTLPHALLVSFIMDAAKWRRPPTH